MPTDSAVSRAAHQASLQTFVASARGVPDAAWEVPITADKWSPAQIAEHLRMVYDVLGRQLAGGPGLQVRTSWWLRLVLRFRFLPRILEHGSIPAGARAPREARPGRPRGPRRHSRPERRIPTSPSPITCSVGSRPPRPFDS